jgi:hypothetical protein
MGYKALEGCSGKVGHQRLATDVSGVDTRAELRCNSRATAAPGGAGEVAVARVVAHSGFRSGFPFRVPLPAPLYLMSDELELVSGSKKKGSPEPVVDQLRATPAPTRLGAPISGSSRSDSTASASGSGHSCTRAAASEAKRNLGSGQLLQDGVYLGELGYASGRASAWSAWLAQNVVLCQEASPRQE